MREADRDTSGVRIPPPLIFLAGLLLGFLFNWAQPAAIASAGGVVAIRVAGGLLVLMAGGLAASAFRAFRRAGTNVNPREPTTALVQTGPYRFTRNPMYASLAMLVAGIALLVNTWWPVVLLIPTLVVVRYAVIAREERYLKAKFGDAYRQYTRRVRRWL